MEVDVCMVIFDGINREFRWVDLKVEFDEPRRWVLKSVWNGGCGVVFEKHSCVGELRGEGESFWCSYYRKIRWTVDEEEDGRDCEVVWKYYMVCVTFFGRISEYVSLWSEFLSENVFSSSKKRHISFLDLSYVSTL